MLKIQSHTTPKTLITHNLKGDSRKHNVPFCRISRISGLARQSGLPGGEGRARFHRCRGCRVYRRDGAHGPSRAPRSARPVLPGRFATNCQQCQLCQKRTLCRYIFPAHYRTLHCEHTTQKRCKLLHELPSDFSCSFCVSDADPVLVYVALGLAILAYILLALLAIYVAILQRRLQRLTNRVNNAPPSAETLSIPYVVPAENKIPLENRLNELSDDTLTTRDSTLSYDE